MSQILNLKTKTKKQSSLCHSHVSADSDQGLLVNVGLMGQFEYLRYIFTMFKYENLEVLLNYYFNAFFVLIQKNACSGVLNSGVGFKYCNRCGTYG